MLQMIGFHLGTKGRSHKVMIVVLLVLVVVEVKARNIGSYRTSKMEITIMLLGG